MRPSPWIALALILLGLAVIRAPLPAQQLCGAPVDPQWWTTPERESWTKTSTSKDVRTLLAALQKAHPDAFRITEIGASLRGRPIQAAVVQRAATGDTPRLRALILANIHGGEVEGKEAVQVLLREIALGGHGDILAACDLWFVPIYNVDGNDEMQPGNRPSQNGPEAIGVRRNAQSLDLNRDAVKAETPETRALLGLFRRVDPHFFMDLHTTNGSPHGYHLTYAPSLCPNVDAALDEFMHGEFIPQVRASVLKDDGFRVFDYGNFGRGRGEPTSWTTYDHTPRYAINYFGLRNRLGLLSEAYSYLPFRERALATRAFVLASLRRLAAHREKILALCAAADQRTAAGGLRFGYDTRLRQAERREVLVGEVSREGSRSVAGKAFRAVEMDVRIRFESQASVPYPQAWALVDASDAVRRTLLLHGVQVHELQDGIEVEGERFEVGSARRPRFRFEGHSPVTLRGKLVAGKHRLAPGTLIVPARQPAARIAAQLLEARSEDSLATWNFFDASLRSTDSGAGTGAGSGADRGTDSGTDTGTYPVLRVTTLPQWKTKPLALREGDAAIDAAYSVAPAQVPDNAVVVSVVCTKTGTRANARGYETNVRWRGREISYGIGPQTFRQLDDVRKAVADLVANPSTAAAPFVLRPGNTITNAEILQCAQSLNEAGAKKVFLQREPE